MSITTTTETVRPWQQLGGIMQPIAAAKKKKGKRSGRAGEMQAKLLSKPQSFPATPRVFFCGFFCGIAACIARTFKK